MLGSIWTLKAWKHGQTSHQEEVAVSSNVHQKARGLTLSGNPNWMRRCICYCTSRVIQIHTCEKQDQLHSVSETAH